jgi:hypothetical protein
MSYGNDISVYVEDKLGDQGFNPALGGPFWLSPDVDIPAHTGEAAQGSNDVKIRVHTHDEPALQEKIRSEVYVGNPSLAMSPTVGTRRIDPGLVFRPPGVAGTEPVADLAGGIATFPWTPSNDPAAVDGPGHRCLILRAFPESVTPPSDPFDVYNEPHEAQHNIEILLATHMQKKSGGPAGAGTKGDPRRRDPDGLWSDLISTVGPRGPGVRFVVWAFDPHPPESIRHALRHTTVSREPPLKVDIEPDPDCGKPIDPLGLLHNGPFVEQSGLGQGLWTEDRLLAGAELELRLKELSTLTLRFDHSNLKPHSAVVLHGAQWDEHGRAEGGLTVVAVAPV